MREGGEFRELMLQVFALACLSVEPATNFKNGIMQESLRNATNIK